MKRLFIVRGFRRVGRVNFALRGRPKTRDLDIENSGKHQNAVEPLTAQQRERRRIELLNPEFMRSQRYENFRKYGETYVLAPDAYARPAISRVNLELILNFLIPPNEKGADRSFVKETILRDDGRADIER
jgi:hypothetical protein